MGCTPAMPRHASPIQKPPAVPQAAPLEQDGQVLLVSGASKQPPLWKVASALAAVYFAWGATYLAIRVAVHTFPPTILAGTRFTVAGTILLMFCLVRGKPMPANRTQWRNVIVVGLMLFLGANGAVCWAEQYISSGLTALIISTIPIWILSMEALMPRGERLSRRDMASFAIGLAGVAILVSPQLLDGSATSTSGVLAVIFATAVWAAGSTIARHGQMAPSIWTTASIEMLAGGLGLLLTAALRNDWQQFSLARVPWQAWAGWAYLVVFGSLVAFSAYSWLLASVRASLTGTSAYVNPVVAVTLGVLVLDEPVSPTLVTGSLITLVAVVMIVTRKAPAVARIATKPPGHQPESIGEGSVTAACPSNSNCD